MLAAVLTLSEVCAFFASFEGTFSPFRRHNVANVCGQLRALLLVATDDYSTMGLAGVCEIKDADGSFRALFS
jgi:hypothetical protein